MDPTLTMKNFSRAKTIVLAPEIVTFNGLSRANNHKCPQKISYK